VVSTPKSLRNRDEDVATLAFNSGVITPEFVVSLPDRCFEDRETSAMNKSPVLAAILNFFLFGAGYVYNGKRVAWGVALTLALVLVRYADINIFLSGENRGVWFFMMVGLFILQFAFAWDGYQEAQNLRTTSKHL
jgi:hypothetical protein